VTEYVLPSKDIFNDCFIVHGHDNRYQEVARFIEHEFKLNAKILHEETNEGQTLIEKFEKNSIVDFAVCLWTADDEGKSKNYGNLKYRPRQNVIFETGFFIGKLGRRYVIVLLDKGIELPSDYDGVNYIAFEENWQHKLYTEIKKILEIN
jgi:predicted nucleotide-binding protein